MIDSTAYSGVSAHAASMQSDGKLLLGGGCVDAAQKTHFCVARYLHNGQLDSTSGTNGHVVTTMGGGVGVVQGLTVQNDEKIVAAGLCGAFPYVSCMARYDPRGALDSSFADNGILISPQSSGNTWFNDVRVLPSGHIVVAGACPLLTQIAGTSELCLTRYLSDGTLDVAYGNAGVAKLAIGMVSIAAAMAIQRDGKAVVITSCEGTQLSRSAFCVVRFGSDGVPDPSFGDNGVARTLVGSSPSSSLQAPAALVLMQDGRIVVGGHCAPANALSFCSIRHFADGTLDTSFGVSGLVVTPIGLSGGVKSLALQVDGKLLAVGDCFVTTTQIDFCAARYLSDGTLDAAFGVGGIVSTPIGGGTDRGEKLLLQTDGTYVVAGYCAAGGSQRFCLARFQGGPYAVQACTLNSDGNLMVDPATDALLTTRYLLGYRGDALTTGAVGASPTRTNAEIETYLGTLMQAGKLDVDGDGQSLAMTDGLLLVRAMLGLSGTALTNGATNAAHPNVRDAQQILTWIEATHGVACLP